MDQESQIPYKKIANEDDSDPTRRKKPAYLSHVSDIAVDNTLITMSFLEKLFEPDNIHENESIKSMKQVGGLDALVNELKTNAENGIDETGLENRLAKYGKNDPIIKAPKGLLKLILEQLEDTMLRILILAGIVSLIVGMIKDGPSEGWMEGVTIFVAIMIVVVVGSTNNYLKEKQFAELTSKHDARNVLVVRNGARKYISIFDLTVGDLMIFDIGEIFPVDGIMVKGSRVHIDESSVTGESDLIQKESLTLAISSMDQKRQPFLVSGSKCIDGTGEMIVCCISESSRLGKLRLSLNEESPPTPLQLKLEKVAEDIGKLGVSVALLTFVAMIIHLAISCAKGDQNFISMETLNQIIDFLILGITIIVVAVPEGLPLAVTIALAYSVGKMKDENNLVRHMPSCEIMGGANNICTDKTGTLTQNKMSVVKLFFLGQTYETKELLENEKNIKPEAIKTFCEGICMNSTANPVFEEGKQPEQLGNKTECALLELTHDLNFNYTQIRKHLRVVRSVPFSSSRKKMTTVVATEDPDKYYVYTKGAPEFLLQNCSYFLDENYQIRDLTKEKKIQLEEKVIKKMAQSSLRTLAITFSAIREKELRTFNDEELEEETTLLAIVGIKDPLREGVIEAINKCKRAGITVRMVTGDNTQTAVAIARECGILPAQFDYESTDTDDYTVMEGKKFRELVEIVENPDTGTKVVKDEFTFALIESKLKVLARSSPEDKYALVTGLIQLGRVVAATGDGTNDAPALKKADIGFAMGIAGTRVAQEAAGIILLDDNFSSIVTACKWGRNIYDSIRKFLQFQLTVNLVALFMAFLGGVVVKKSPLNSIQMLWVNLIMDTFASLALATEPPTEELLKRPPYARNEYIITGTMWRNVLGQALYQIALLTVILFRGPQMFDVQNSYDSDEYSEETAAHFTIFFNTFVFMQIFNEINCRKLKSREFNVFKGFFNNPLFLLIEVATIGVQIILVTFGGSFVKVSRLSVIQHLYCVAMGAGALIFGFVMKLFPAEWFARIPFLKDEEPFKVQELDSSLSSLLKRRASSRFRFSSGGSRKLSGKSSSNVS